MSQQAKSDVLGAKVALVFGCAFFLAALLIVIANTWFPDEFGQIAPPPYDRYAWLAVALAAAILLGSALVLRRRIRKRQLGAP